MQQPILVLGAGSWGTALAVILARNGHMVWLWGRNAEHIEIMRKTRQNHQFLPYIAFPDTLQPISTLEEHVHEVRDIVVVVPSQGFQDILTRLAPHITAHTRICWATKGLEYQTGLLLHQVAERILGQSVPLAILSGPSFAIEIARDLPTAVTVASTVGDYAQDLVKLFHTQRFRLYTSTDIVGVQLGGAIKNVIAIAAGASDGLGFGANSRAALITRGLSEIVRLGTVLGGQRETFMGLAGLGDLVLTCTDNLSRNRRFGYALAQGKSAELAKNEIGQVVEGEYAAQAVQHLANLFQIEMPITFQVCKVLQEECTPKEAVHALLSREPKQELL